MRLARPLALAALTAALLVPASPALASTGCALGTHPGGWATTHTLIQGRPPGHTGPYERVWKVVTYGVHRGYERKWC